MRCNCYYTDHLIKESRKIRGTVTAATVALQAAKRTTSVRACVILCDFLVNL